jgi:PKD repeat protein
VSGSAAAKDDGDDVTVSGGTTYEVVGAAPGARLWGFKVLGSNGSGAVSDIIAAIDRITTYAPGQVPTPSETIEVVNMSLGGLMSQQTFRQAIQASVAKGVVYVVAAGNDSTEIYGPDGVLNESSTSNCFKRRAKCDYSPAAYPEVMTVSGMADTDGQPGGQGPSTSSGDDDRFYTSTNFSRSVDGSNPVVSPGLAIDVAAPGVRVLSTWWNPSTGSESWAWGTGTSMASPHVAGAVALYILENNSTAVDAADVYAIRQALIDTAEPQTDWRAGQTTNDPDGNPEGLIKVAGGGGPQEPSPPTALFTDACMGLDCSFTDTSVDDGTIVSWSWDFGDSSPTSTEQNPSHRYAANDTYVVSLVVRDNDGNFSETTSWNVTVDGTPTALFSFSCNDLTLTCDFMDTSSDSDGTIVSWSWDFGEPTSGANTSAETNPSHTYAAAGTYTVSLTVTDNDNLSDTTSQPVTVSAPGSGADVTLDLSGTSVNNGRTWTAQVTITALVGNADGQAVNGSWSGGANGPDNCPIIGGSCIAEVTGIRKKRSNVTFTVESVGGLNFDGETVITLFKP